MRDLAKNYVRLSQLDVKKLVTDIKFCKIFDDDLIFKAIQYNVARDVIDEDTLFAYRDYELLEGARSGTVASSVVNLCATAMGAGVLSLPKAFSNAGMLLGTALVSASGSALNQWLGMVLKF